jgi:hypothetical protein
MFQIDNDLYRISPAYRKLADYARRLEGENGALGAAYGNAVNDHRRRQSNLESFAQTMQTMAEAIEQQVQQAWTVLRDDPGRGGSGG